MWDTGALDWRTFVIGSKDLNVAYAFFADEPLHELVIKPLQFMFCEVVCAIANQRTYQMEVCQFMCRLMRERLMTRMEIINYISYTYLNWIVDLRGKNARSQVDFETLRKTLSEIDALDTLNTSPNDVTKKISELIASTNAVLDTASVDKAQAQFTDEDLSKIDNAIHLQLESAQATLQESLRALEDVPHQYNKYITPQTSAAVEIAADLTVEVIWNIFNDFCFEQNLQPHTWPEHTSFGETVAAKIHAEYESYLNDAAQREKLSKCIDELKTGEKSSSSIVTAAPKSTKKRKSTAAVDPTRAATALTLDASRSATAISPDPARAAATPAPTKGAPIAATSSSGALPKKRKATEDSNPKKKAKIPSSAGGAAKSPTKKTPVDDSWKKLLTAFDVDSEHDELANDPFIKKSLQRKNSYLLGIYVEWGHLIPHFVQGAKNVLQATVPTPPDKALDIS
jgi:hypothetical protein